ncbi:MAG: hypothetical protein JOZ99_05825, partial [Actinobacteria bacterium]|nr:hypothetical protein [Actinomycetota bacterium]
SLGATDQQIEAAWRDCHVVGLAADVVLARDGKFSASDVAVSTGVDVDVVVAIWRLLGVSVPNVTAPLFSDFDARLTGRLVQFGPVGPNNELLRVLGSALARVAEASVAMYVQTVEPELSAPEVELVVWARDIAATTATALELGNAMGTIFSHHLRDAITRQRVAQTGVTEPSLFRLAVGFVDLVGFTPLSRKVPPSELLRVIGNFESRAFEIVTGYDGRVVKHIGDEIMFVALDARSGCLTARALTQAFAADDVEPRGGIAFGEVISRYGDYYGAVVNLASRLVDLAIPHEVLVDSPTTAAVSPPVAGEGDDLTFLPAGRRLLKGFDEPIEVYSVAGSVT